MPLLLKRVRAWTDHLLRTGGSETREDWGSLVRLLRCGSCDHWPESESAADWEREISGIKRKQLLERHYSAVSIIPTALRERREKSSRAPQETTSSSSRGNRARYNRRWLKNWNPLPQAGKSKLQVSLKTLQRNSSPSANAGFIGGKASWITHFWPYIWLKEPFSSLGTCIESGLSLGPRSGIWLNSSTPTTRSVVTPSPNAGVLLVQLCRFLDST